MENWKAILSPELVLDQITKILTDLPEGVVIAGLLLPFVVAALSRRPLAAAAALLLGVLTYVISIGPVYLTQALAISSYLGSLLIALLAIRSRRKDRARTAEFVALQKDVAGLRYSLRQMEERRMLVELRSANELAQDDSTVKKSGASERPA